MLIGHASLAAEIPPSPPTWIINGFRAALGDPTPGLFVAANNLALASGLWEAVREHKAELGPKIAALLADPDSDVRAAAVQALGALGAKDQAGAIAALLAAPAWQVRQAAVQALGALGAKDQAGAIAALLAAPDSDVRAAAVQALGALGAPNEAVALVLLAATDRSPDQSAGLRLAAHIVGAGRQRPEIWTAWLGRPPALPIELVKKDGGLARETLAAFQTAWAPAASFLVLRNELATRISTVVAQACPGPRAPVPVPVPVGDSPVERLAGVARQTAGWLLGVLGPACWGIADRELFLGLAADLREGGYPQADTVDKAVAAIDRRDVGLDVVAVVGGHVLFWCLLIAAYPRWPTVQAIFFWNPWVRRIGGLAYVGFLLAYVPFLRQRLFEPFRESLLAEADLAHLDQASYFARSDVRTDTGAVLAVDEAIPEIRGQVVLEGDSGLGKSLFLRRLAGRSRRVAVYLPARRCEAGVLQAIQAKLHGPAQDADFLKQLVHLGAIDIAIDGLNEVSAETRATIGGFVEQFFKGNVILATQPMEWAKPATARAHRLLPLGREQIEGFLVSRAGELPATATVTGEAYGRAARMFLARTFDALATTPDREALQRALSNPMDLTLVAQVLGQEREPDLMALQEQGYRLMADDYAVTNQGTPFPLKPFAEQVYAMRLADEKALAGGDIPDEIAAMERHKMLLRRVGAGGETEMEWRFRHDKVMEFFIHHAFLAAPTRIAEHMDDPRFRGVYFLLAQRLPVEDARRLRERLIERAADTGDHTLSDEVVRILRGRLEAAPELTPPASI